MTNFDNLIKQIEAVETNIYEKLTIQDALVLIPVSKAEINQENLKYIVTLAHAHPLFHEDIGVTEKRINKFANLTIAAERKNERKKAIRLAAMSLTPELREIAFTWTADLMMQKGDLSDNKKESLENLRIALSIEKRSAEKILQNIKNKHLR